MSRQQKELRLLWFSTLSLSAALILLIVTLVADNHPYAVAKQGNESQAFEMKMERYEIDSIDTIESYRIDNRVFPESTPTPLKGFFIASGANPTPTPTVCAPASNDINCNGIPNSEDGDADGDGIPNEQDTNDDNDGIPDSQDSTPGGPGTSQGSWGPGGIGQGWCNNCPTNTPTYTPSNTPTLTPTHTPLCFNDLKVESLTVSKNALTAFDITVYDIKLHAGSLAIRPDVDGLSNSDGIGGDDRVCCFEIVRSGNVQVIYDPFLTSIDSNAEFETLRSYSYGINVVSAITIDGGLWGYARLGDPYFAVSSNSGNLTEYHEHGHTKGLDHVFSATWNQNLMHETTFGNQTTFSQCNSF